MTVVVATAIPRAHVDEAHAEAEEEEEGVLPLLRGAVATIPDYSNKGPRLRTMRPARPVVFCFVDCVGCGLWVGESELGMIDVLVCREGRVGWDV